MIPWPIRARSRGSERKPGQRTNLVAAWSMFVSSVAPAGLERLGPRDLPQAPGMTGKVSRLLGKVDPCTRPQTAP
jgi:hypothetical protein